MYSTVAFCVCLFASFYPAVHLRVRQYLHVGLKAVIEAVPSSPSLVAGIQSLIISQGGLLYAVLALAVGVANSGAGGASETRGEGL